MDIDQMGGSTLQAMADAVENATVVFICMSQKYKDSPNCRAGNNNPIAFRKAKLYTVLVFLSAIELRSYSSKASFNSK